MASRNSSGNFSYCCTTKALHDQWSLSGPDLGTYISYNKLRKLVVKKLIELCGLQLPPSKLKHTKFCLACVNKVYDLFPCLIPEKVEDDHAYSCYGKRQKVDQTSVKLTDNATQTSV